MASITTWHRLVPISRSSDFETALAAEIRDPLWFLSRQRQLGEMQGEDTGSPTFVRIGYKAAPLTEVVLSSGHGTPKTVTVDPNKPFEAQILAEPHSPDLAMRAELGLVFFDIVSEAFGAAADDVKSAFRAVAALQISAPATQAANFDPVDTSSSAFALLAVGRLVDGFEIHRRVKAGTIPADIVPPDQRAKLANAYAAFSQWVESAFGAIATTDPDGWNPSRLDYDVALKFGTDSPMTVAVHPNENGSVDWSSFDVTTPTANPFPAALPLQIAREIPTHVRFPGMPAPRYWDFESGELPWPNLDVARTELARLLVVDFAMLYGVDWFVVPLEVEVGGAVKIDSLVVYDVFGGRTVIDRVEDGRSQNPPERFTMYSAAAPDGGVGNFLVLPPLSGSALQYGPVLEEVRFARDEVANMAWAIEASTESRIGDRRRGSEREGAVDAANPAAPVESTEALRYAIESKVPTYWVPLLSPSGTPASTTLEKGATLRDLEGELVPVPSLGKVLNPPGVTPYQIFDEEVPKAGVRVERLVYSSRSRDGKSYLWVARRKRPGSGETQSGLRFDAAQPLKA
jgi:hypothetical protein